MGYNRSGTRRAKRLKRRKRLDERLALKGADAKKTVATAGEKKG